MTPPPQHGRYICMLPKAEFIEVAKRSVRSMKEAVRCFEDIDSEIKDAGFD